MPLYRATIAGHKPVLISGPSAAKALANFVSLATMKGEEIIAAMEAGERAYKAGDKIELADAHKPYYRDPRDPELEENQ